MANGKRKVNLNKRIAGVLKGLVIYALIAFVSLMFFYQVSGPPPAGNEVPISQIISDVKESKIQKLSLEGTRVTVEYKEGGQKLLSHKEEGESMYKILESSGVDPKSVTIEVKDTSMQQAWAGVISAILPVLLLVGLMFLLFRNAREAGQGIFSFAQSKARLFTKDQPQAKFSDVAGLPEAKKELEEVVDFLKNPKKYQDIGARTPKGVLLVGPPGVGKTLLARSVAGEAGVPFFSISGSEFMEILVGVGAARTRDMFAQAKKNAPSIIFIDEIESIGRARGMGFTGGHDEREQTLNQILVEMDGFTPNEAVTVIGASVSGDTPILIKEEGVVKLLPVGEFIDQYYSDDQEGVEKLVNGIETLGFEKRQLIGKDNRLYFQNSTFKKVRSVFRHKVDEIYEITYLGGKIRTTGNHCVFVRTHSGIKSKRVSELQVRDILVNLPLKYRSAKKLTEVRSHRFDHNFNLSLPVYQNTEEDSKWEQKYIFVQDNYGALSQSQIASEIDVSQTTVGNWLRGVFLPRAISRSYFNHKLPQVVEVTPLLCRLLGYYTAEGYARKGVDFCFNKKEIDLTSDLKSLMKNIFELNPDKERFITDNAINIIYYSKPLGDFFIKHCGKGAKYKHAPSFLFEAPKEYFLEFLRGVLLGDGYVDKQGKGQITSVSKQLIMELNWLCRMHGIKSYTGSFVIREGRVIKNGKPLKGTTAYRLGFGKHNNPFIQIKGGKDNPIKRAIVKSVKKLPFEGYVYDLCGVENEAFFGGESPLLLHNSNRPDMLDPALVRPGRFDRRVVLNMPDLIERKAIIELHMKGKPFTEDVNIERLARRTVGFSGADLANMLNEAAILAAREAKKAIDNKDLEEAATKVKLGPQRKRMQTEEDRKLAAYHEAGHAIVGHNLPKVDPVHRITIVARGMSGGHTMFPPTEDRSNETRSRLLEQITTALGGRAAEDMIFKDSSTGAANDLELATGIARDMVTEYGMSALGPINIKSHPIFGLWARQDEGGVSQAMQSKIDNEVKKIIDSCYKQAVIILQKNKAKLDKVAKALLDKETLDTDEFEKLVGKKK